MSNDTTFEAQPAAPLPVMPGKASELLEWRLRQMGLAVPPLPEPLVERLEAYGEFHFATEEPVYAPYDVEANVMQCLSGGRDYFRVAVDGHGINSWALHYFLVWGPVACFLQLPWGGAYMDEDVARAEIARAFAGVERLLHARPHDGDQVLVIDGFHVSGWAILKPDEEEIELEDVEDPLTAAREALGVGGELDTDGRHASAPFTGTPV